MGAHEEHHDGFSIDARADAGARGNALSESGDRLAQARPELASVYLFGFGDARAHTRWRPDCRGFAARRTRGHADVESQRAPGGVLWRSAGRRRGSHSQSAPPSSAACRDRQSCRRPISDRGRCASAVTRNIHPRRALRTRVRPPQRPSFVRPLRRLRSVAQNGARRWPFAPVERERRRGHVLHLRHHGRSERSGLLASRAGAAFAGAGHGGLLRRFAPRLRAARGAHVSRQCLGLPLRGYAGGRQAGAARAAPGRGEPSRSMRARAGDLGHRRADGVDGRLRRIGQKPEALAPCARLAACRRRLRAGRVADSPLRRP